MLIVFVGIIPGRAKAQGSEPPDSRIRPGVLHLNATELLLELEASYERRRVGSEEPGTYSQRNRDSMFEESVSLRLGGDIVDPLLVDWNAYLKLGLIQERFHERIGRFDQTDSDTGVLLEYDISLNFLSSKPFSATAYARQGRDRIPRRFLPSLLEERSEAGVTGLLRLDNFTSEIGIEWSDVEQSGNRAERDDESLEATRAFVDNRWQIDDGHSLRISFDHQGETTKYQGTRERFDTQRDELRVEHELLFGEHKKHSLDTFIRINNEKGDLARDEFEATPRLTLRHNDTFKTIYRYSFYRTDQDAIELDRHEFDWQAVYEPDKFLRVTGTVFGLREMIEDDVETQQYGGGVDLTYRRPTQCGDFLANFAANVDREESDGDADGGLVRGESHVLDPTRPTFLARPDIRRVTILAYSVDRTRVYVNGVDYQVVAVGRRTTVYRLLSGRIADGEAVLVDYTYRIHTDGRVDTRRFDLRLEHAFLSGFTPYYDLGLRRQDADGSTGIPAFEDNTERHRLGLRYDRDYWSAFAEAELFDDSVEPYDAYHAGTRATLIRDLQHTMDATATVSWFNFTGDFDRRSVGLADIGLTNRLTLDEYLSASLSTIYRWEGDTEDGETNGVDLEYGIKFRRGQLEVDLTIEYDLLTLGDHEEGFGAWLTVRRDLSHVLSRPKGRPW
jgi:hypothetical protein